MAVRTLSSLFWTLFFICFTDAAFGDDTVTCLYQSSCVLPCSFSSGPDALITWTKREGPLIVHDFYNGENQLQLQHEGFRGRTALYEDRIRSGNASLLLRDVRVEDEGTYECLTANGAVKTTRVRVRVAAPVVAVTLGRRGAELVCGSENIYPKPAVTFNPEPPDKPLTSFTSSEAGLFSVNSSVPLTQRPPLEYSCNVSTGHDWRSATYRRNADIAVSDSVTVPCTEPAAPVKRLLWSFNHKGILSKKTGSEPVISESWRPFVDGLTKSNSLVLKDLTQDQLGLFSCELSTESEEFIVHTEVTEATEATEALAVGAESTDAGLKVLEWIATALFFMSVIALVICHCNQKNPKFKTLVNTLKTVPSVIQNQRSSSGERRRSPDDTESLPMRQTGRREEETSDCR